ncbi:MAG TPA: multidrug effflux MFS transporter [Massilibacterium sp.]|nr:multidrug effflux MFS transporter [Massilibacterium sp.]
MNQTTQLKETKGLRRFWFVLILGALTAFGPLSIDMYLPAFPAVTNDLQTTPSLVQLSLTFCLLGLAAGQLVIGPLSDIRGRRKPLIIAMILYSIASFFSALTPNIGIFIALRFVQGFTGAAGIVIARAIARDLYSGKELTKFFALLMLINGAAPILAPIIGGIILSFSVWQTVFFILAIFGIFMFLGVSFGVPETLPQENRSTGGFTETIEAFRALIKDRTFIGFALTQALIMTSMFAYISGSPFVIQNIYGASAQTFSLLFALNGIGIIVATQLTGKLVDYVSEQTLFFSGLFLSLVGSIFLLVSIYLHLSLVSVSIALFLVVSSVGIVSTTTFSLAMQNQTKNIGSASALLGLFPFAGGAIVAPLVGIAGDQTALPMAIIIFILSVSSILLYLFLIKKN